MKSNHKNALEKHIIKKLKKLKYKIERLIEKVIPMNSVSATFVLIEWKRPNHKIGDNRLNTKMH